MLAGFWLFSLPAVFAGVLEVLIPLRFDDLGASGVAIGAAFLVAAGFEAMVSAAAGRLSDRHGRLAPIRVGLAGAAVMAVLLPLPDVALLLGAALVLVVCALGGFWAPAMALLSDASERAGLDQALAFSIATSPGRSGTCSAAARGGALADATSDALVYGLLGAACALTLLGVMALGLGRPGRLDGGALTRGSSARARCPRGGTA